jgi:hypothetical protein
LNITDKDNPDHQKKEDYAFCFLILFVPFRSGKDQETDDCYQIVLRIAHGEGRSSKEMIQIAENIQTLNNSLASDVVENSLSAAKKILEMGDLKPQMKTRTIMKTWRMFWLALVNCTLP